MWFWCFYVLYIVRPNGEEGFIMKQNKIIIAYDESAEVEMNWSSVRFTEDHYKSYDPEYCCTPFHDMLDEHYPWGDEEETCTKARVTKQIIKNKNLREVRWPMFKQRLASEVPETRDRDISQYLKSLYGYACQCCGLGLLLPDGKSGVETHHLHPIGEGGADSVENMIVVCPNCHTLLDAGAVKINTETSKLMHFIGVYEPHGKTMTVKHSISYHSIEYQNAKYKY